MNGYDFVYHTDSVPLPAVDSVTDLGVPYDNNLKFCPLFVYCV